MPMNLKNYLHKNKIEVPVFAESIGVTPFSLYRYLRGVRRPREEILKKIAEVTNGKVTPNDFYGVS